MTRLLGKTVLIDSAPIIYFVERHPVNHSKVKPIFEAHDSGRLTLVSTVLVLAEVLVLPLQQNRQDISNAYMDILTGSGRFITHHIDHDIAIRAAGLRATYSLKTPDALNAAAAIVHGAHVLLSNDRGLKRLREIEVVLVSEL